MFNKLFKLFCFDLDGTLADITHRLHFIRQDVVDGKKSSKDWASFFKACPMDEPIPWTIDLLRQCAEYGSILILTGRSEEIRKETEQWLERHFVFFHHLVMRPIKDHRPDNVLKPELLNKFLEENTFDGVPRYKVQFIVEDRKRVVEVYRKAGFHVLQCESLNN